MTGRKDDLALQIKKVNLSCSSYVKTLLLEEAIKNNTGSLIG